MKKFKAFFTVFSMIFAAVCIVSVSEAEARVTIGVQNTTKDKVYLAFRWSGFDMPDDRRQGWFVVQAGKFEAFTFEDVVYGLTADDFGYYAEGGGKVWAGKSSDKHMGVIIHSTKSFKGHPDAPISGGKKVYFKRLSLKQLGDTEHAMGTIVIK
jgi:uncharacterized membrane protein